MDLFDRFGGERRVVVWRVKYHLTYALTGPNVVDPVGLDGGFIRVRFEAWKKVLEGNYVVVRLRHLCRKVSGFSRTQRTKIRRR
jgi:hypothetical protein